VNSIASTAEKRKSVISTVGEAEKPWLYLIVATGNIYEDIPQAQAAARNGADVIAVIRSTGQSLIDYVPYGATTEGFAGTFATQENFRLMRAALDEVGEELGRYIRLTNYASGLCMPEIATMAATERLDMMLNDCMYGIIFRDINMQRTFIDQHFSRMVHALAGIVINTGEDNYLTTANAIDAAHTVLASQFLNEHLASSAGLASEQMGLGHAFEIDPEVPDQILLELAHAQLIRECFPDAPLKYMPPTKHMTGNIFLGFLYDGMFNLVGALTGQDIILLGMMTEGSHTPFLSDRHLALENANYVFGGAAGLAGEMKFEAGGQVERRASQVLEECRQMLQKVSEIGMFEAIEAGMFGDTVRKRDGGKGLEGVIRCNAAYMNPITDLLSKRLGVS
jgi:beta-lysine 5,6-aminomutase alpha subunit